MSKRTVFSDSRKKKFFITFIRTLYLSKKQQKFITTDLASAYIPNEVEVFKPESYFEPNLKSVKPFSLILPPPNITGTLHLGHALTATVEDVLIRWHRMRGIPTVWVPGMDHAGIATQVVVEKKIFKEKHLTRHQLGRELFEEEVWKWKNDKADTIKQQLYRLGLSLDWTKETFTMDSRQSFAVKKAFVQLFENNLIYRENYLVSWCCALQSAISDIEVEHVAINGPTLLDVPGYEDPIEFGVLTQFAYKLTNSDEEIVVATTRPETMLGDVAVAVHPKDERYTKMIGSRLQHPFRNEEIPVITSETVDPNFGTGAVKITPAHDPVDFDVGRRYDLPILQIIDEKGKLKETCGHFTGLSRFEARNVIVGELNRLNLLRARQDHDMIVPICSRSRDVVEFLVKPQWFVRCRQMAEKAAEAARNGQLRIEPQQYEKSWFTWLDNIRDWCISRQLWWGHRVPAYLCHSPNNPQEQVWVAAEDDDSARVKASQKLSIDKDVVVVKPDEDVLDTWFSSSLLPFSVFGWPQKTSEIDKYYPLSLMETGHDILFFWVARMVMLGVELTGKLPFEKILLHGVICDAYGKKMSKSLGNVISPEEIISGSTLQELENKCRASNKLGILTDSETTRAIESQRKMFPEGIPACGVDALRFTLCSHNIKNHFINFDVNECNINRLFCNKIWQATKFTKHWVMKICDAQNVSDSRSSPYSSMDRWILSRLSSMVETVNKSLEDNDFHIGTSSIKNFLYYEFCDIYLECTKRNLQSTQSTEAASCSIVLARSLDVSLRTLAPFMPHLSQLLHQHLPLEIIGFPRDHTYPRAVGVRDVKLEEDVATVMNAIVAIRRLKKLFGISKKHDSEVRVISTSPLFSNFSSVIKDLSGSERVEFFEHSAPDSTNFVAESVGNVATIEIYLPEERKKTLDFDEGKLEKKRSKLLKELEKLEKMISAESYKTNAPVKAQQAHTKKITSLADDLARIECIQKVARKIYLNK